MTVAPPPVRAAAVCAELPAPKVKAVLGLTVGQYPTASSASFGSHPKNVRQSMCEYKAAGGGLVILVVARSTSPSGKERIRAHFWDLKRSGGHALVQGLGSAAFWDPEVDSMDVLTTRGEFLSLTAVRNVVNHTSIARPKVTKMCRLIEDLMAQNG